MSQLRHCCSRYSFCYDLLLYNFWADRKNLAWLLLYQETKLTSIAEALSHLLTLVTAKMNANQDFLQAQPIWILPMMGHSLSHSRSRNPSVPVAYLQKWPIPAAEEEANCTAVDVYVVICPEGEFHPFRLSWFRSCIWSFRSPPKLLGISVCLFNFSIYNYGCSVYPCECLSLFS